MTRAAQRASPTRPCFREPVNHVTVHLDAGLAFVRAEARFILEG